MEQHSTGQVKVFSGFCLFAAFGKYIRLRIHRPKSWQGLRVLPSMIELYPAKQSAYRMWSGNHKEQSSCRMNMIRFFD